MKRLARLFSFAVLASGAFSMGAAADESGRHAFGEPGGRGLALGGLRRCLSVLDLSEDQKSAIRQILSDAKSTLQADIQTVHSDHEKLQADIANGADKCVVGQDALTHHADAARLRGDVQAVRDQVFAKLTTEQQNRVKSCFDAIGANRFARRNG